MEAIVQHVIVAEKTALKPKKRKELESAGFIVLLVDNVNQIKILTDQPTPPPVDDGFNLDG